MPESLRSTSCNDFITNALVYKRRGTRTEGKNRLIVKDMIHMTLNELCGFCRFEVIPFGGGRAGVVVGSIVEAIAKLSIYKKDRTVQ